MKVLLCFQASIARICMESTEIGFELLGFDFMIDENLKVWLIEVNQNPCLDALTQEQGRFVSKLLEDTFAYAMFYAASPSILCWGSALLTSRALGSLLQTASRQTMNLS